MTLLPPMETLIPEDHYLRRLERVTKTMAENYPNASNCSLPFE